VADVPGVVVPAPIPRPGPACSTASTWPGGPSCSAPAGTWGRERDGEAGHPHLAVATAERLVADGAAVVGIDSVNIDDTRGGERPIHTALLAAGIPIVEHLRGLDALGPAPFRFFAVPPAIAGLGTFIVRAFALTEGAGRPASR
jgi:kynurenine formamidase